MAPADMPASGPSSSKHGPIQSTVQDSIEVARLPAVFSTPSTSRNTSTLLSAASSSRISGENAECYDQVRDILCGQPLWKLDQEEVLLQPYTYLASRPGKEIRGQMIDAFNVWLQVPEEKIKVIHKVIGMLHTSSLLVDDVEDNSILRRGAPVAHAVFGVPQTINTANYVYFLVFKDLLAMNRDEPSPERQMQVQEMIVEEMINLHRGQGMEIFWRDNLICPTESEYIEMVNNKTSGLLRIVVKLMVANSSKGSQLGKDALVPLVNLIGLLFQIRDDFMNLRSGDYAENKGYCEDLTEGKFSFPIIHSIRASGSTEAKTGQKETVNGIGVSLSNGHCHNDLQQPSLESWSDIADRHHLLSVLQTRPSDAKTKRIVVEYMERRTESFQYTCEVMTRLDRLVREETIAMEQMLGDGRENVRLRGILGALRQGWWTS